jgi:hypothetical protein
MVRSHAKSFSTARSHTRSFSNSAIVQFSLCNAIVHNSPFVMRSHTIQFFRYSGIVYKSFPKVRSHTNFLSRVQAYTSSLHSAIVYNSFSRARSHNIPLLMCDRVPFLSKVRLHSIPRRKANHTSFCNPVYTVRVAIESVPSYRVFFSGIASTVLRSEGR